MKVKLEEIGIRNQLVPGDLGYVIHLHGLLYGVEYGYGVQFETYVAHGMYEFYKNFDAERDRVWLCEHSGSIIGSLVLMHRPKRAAQLRYFLVRPEYRGIGLGKKLLELYMEFLLSHSYRSSYLWTTDELRAAASLYKLHGFTLTKEVESRAFGKPVKEQRYDYIVREKS